MSKARKIANATTATTADVEDLFTYGSFNTSAVDGGEINGIIDARISDSISVITQTINGGVIS
jgi:hypothetical protein